MEPSTGKRTTASPNDVRQRAYIHEMAVPATAVSDWLRGADIKEILVRRMTDLGVSAEQAENLWAESLREPTWGGVASLDASVRYARSRPATDVKELTSQ